MRSLARKLGLILLIFSGLVGLDRLSHFLTDDFGRVNITSRLSDSPQWDIPFAAEDLEELDIALSQPYSYLASGSQSYAFLSEDGNYVIKFFKHKRWRLTPLANHIPLPSPWREKRERWKAKKKRTVRRTFESCVTAYTTFRKETGVLYVHLNKKIPIDRTLTFKDRIGLKHRIPLDEVEFIVQKRAIPTDTYLLTLKKEGRLAEAEKALSSLIAFAVKRAQKGFSDKDPHLIRNFGFIEDQATQLDVGGFFHDPKKDFHYFKNVELKRIHSKLFPWLEAHYPELIPHAQREFSSREKSL